MPYIHTQLIEYIPLQQGLRPKAFHFAKQAHKGLIEYIPLQQGLRLLFFCYYRFHFPH